MPIFCSVFAPAFAGGFTFQLFVFGLEDVSHSIWTRLVLNVAEWTRWLLIYFTYVLVLIEKWSNLKIYTVCRWGRKNSLIPKEKGVSR